MIEIKNLSKRYPSKNKKKDDFLALNDLSITIETGTIAVVIGQNGSGKSTLLSLLSGQMSSYEGSISVNGTAAPDFTRSNPVGYAAEQALFHPNWTVRELFKFVGAIQRLSKQELVDYSYEVTEHFQLRELLDRRFGTLSKGMRQRVNLAQSLITNSNLIVWDEPTSGLDWVFTDLVESWIQELKERGKTLVFSSHDLFLSKNIGDEVIFLKNGDLRFRGSFLGWDQHLNASNDPIENRLVKQL